MSGLVEHVFSFTKALLKNPADEKTTSNESSNDMSL